VHTDYLKVDHNHPDVAKDMLAWGPWVLQVCFPNGGYQSVSWDDNEYIGDGEGGMDSDWMRSSTWIADSFDNSYVLVD